MLASYSVQVGSSLSADGLQPGLQSQYIQKPKPAQADHTLYCSQSSRCNNLSIGRHYWILPQFTCRGIRSAHRAECARRVFATSANRGVSLFLRLLLPRFHWVMLAVGS